MIPPGSFLLGILTGLIVLSLSWLLGLVVLSLPGLLAMLTLTRLLRLSGHPFVFLLLLIILQSSIFYMSIRRNATLVPE